MRITESLLELGAHVSASVLANSFEGQAMTSMDALKRAACLGHKDVLSDPPPALVHSSGYSSANFLYGIKASPCFSEVPYKSGNPPASLWSNKTGLIGTMMIDCIGKPPQNVEDRANNVGSVPVLLYWKFEDAASSSTGSVHPTLIIVVPNAPLSEMEADLAPSSPSPTSFEKFWLGDEAVSKCAARKVVMDYVHRCGMLNMPSFLLTDNYYIVRKGPISLLRLRKPAGPLERQKCMSVLMQAPCLAASDEGAVGGFLKSIDHFQSIKTPFAVETFYMRGGANQLEIPGSLSAEERADVAHMSNEEAARIVLLKEPIRSCLALTLLKNGLEDGLNGRSSIEDGAPLSNQSWFGDEQADDNSDAAIGEEIDEKSLGEAVQTMVQREREAMSNVAEGGSNGSIDVPVFVSNLFYRTKRPTDVAHSTCVSTTFDAVDAVCGWIFGEEDRAMLATHLTNVSSNGKETVDVGKIKLHMRSIGRCLGMRHALLCVETVASSTEIGEVYLDFASSHPNNKGSHQRCRVTPSAAVRLLLCSFVQPIMLTFDTDSAYISLVRMSGITRERTKLSASAFTVAPAPVPCASGGVTFTKPDLAFISDQIKTHVDFNFKDLAERVIPEYLRSVSMNTNTNTNTNTDSNAGCLMVNVPDSDAVTSLKRSRPKMLHELLRLQQVHARLQ